MSTLAAARINERDYSLADLKAGRKDMVVCTGYNNRLCGKPFAGFVGKDYCDDCVSLWMDDDARDRHRAWIGELSRRDWLQASTFRARFANSNPRMEDYSAYTQARAWYGEKNVFIHGHVGTGKTYMARCMMNAILDRSLGAFRANDEALRNGETRAMVSVCELSALEFCKLSEGGYNAKGYKWLYGIGVLLIDDMDKAPWTERSLSELYQCTDRRRNNQCATILTSNFNTSSVMRDGAEVFGLIKQLQLRVPRNESMISAAFDRLNPVLKLHIDGASLRGQDDAFGNVRQ